MQQTQKIARKKKIGKTAWLIPAGLVLLSFVPMVAGTVRIVQLTSGAEVTPENARFFAAPLPVLIHIISSVLFSVVGAFQFPRGIRHRWHRWHRKAGWVLAFSGIASALSGLWMTLFYPWPAGDGELLFGMRLLVGLVMFLSIVLSITAVLQRKFAAHGDWMIRAYAIGLGAGTQVFTHLPWAIFREGTPDELSRAMMMGAGWAINIIIAEWVIRRRRTQRTQTKPASSLSI